MITILFFARLKDEVGKDQVQLADEFVGKSIAQIQQALVAQGMKALQGNNVLTALNQNFCSQDTIVNAGDEVAFMPPVTGG